MKQMLEKFQLVWQKAFTSATLFHPYLFFLSPPIISPSRFCLRISISLAVLRASSLSSPLLRSLSSVPSTAEGSRYINLLVPLSSSDCRAGRTRSDAQSQPAHSSCFRRTVWAADFRIACLLFSTLYSLQHEHGAFLFSFGYETHQDIQCFSTPLTCGHWLTPRPLQVVKQHR